MKSKHYFLLTILTLFLFEMPGYANEIYFTPPGTRAMAMGGAFVAQADDSSAVWYNPAGLFQKDIARQDYTAEYGSHLTIDENVAFSDEESRLKFLSYKKSRMGMAFFEPYRISFLNVPILEGRMDLRYYQFSYVPMGGAKNNLYWAYSMDAEIISGEYLGAYDGTLYGIGLGGSFGMLAKVVQNKRFNVKLGGVARSPTYHSIEFDDYDLDDLSEIIPARPMSFAGGINASIPHPLGYVNLNASYEYIMWADTVGDTFFKGLNMTKIAIGAEASFILSSNFQISVRAGFHESTPEDDVWSTPKGITYGLGVGLGKNHFLDYAVEDRTLNEGSEFEVGPFSFMSLSYSYQI